MVLADLTLVPEGQVVRAEVELDVVLQGVLRLQTLARVLRVPRVSITGVFKNRLQVTIATRFQFNDVLHFYKRNYLTLCSAMKLGLLCLCRLGVELQNRRLFFQAILSETLSATENY